jgi:ketosteroid isomerase-like protein
MQEAQNTKIVQDAYAAFSRGDIKALLDSFDDNIVWKGVYGASKHVPMSGERRGKAQTTEFFDQVAAHVKFSRFEPQEFLAQGERVVALGHYTATVSTGASFDSDFAMTFKVRGGKIVEFQEFLDVAALNAAFDQARV